MKIGQRDADAEQIQKQTFSNPTTLPVKNIKGAACQRYGDNDGVVWCEQTLRHACWRTDVNAIQLFVKQRIITCNATVLFLGLGPLDAWRILSTTLSIQSNLFKPSSELVANFRHSKQSYSSV